MASKSKVQQEKSFIYIMKSNATQFFLTYIIVGLAPLMFGGFKFDQFAFGIPALIGGAATLGLFLFLLYCFLIYLKSSLFTR